MILCMVLKSDIDILHGIASRKGSGKILTFGIPHVFKALQLLYKNHFVSRSTFCHELNVGEGAVKTMILHLKTEGLADSARAGTFLTDRGKMLSKSLLAVIVGEAVVGRSKLCSGHGHAVLLRDSAHAIRTGLEQRDFAVMYGASVALTMIFDGGMFLFPGEAGDALSKDKKTLGALMSMEPRDGDVVIMASANDPFVAEIAVKNSALGTITSL